MNATEPPLPPYARALGMRLAGEKGGMPVLALDFTDDVVGRPGYVHGGALGGLLEIAALTALKHALAERGDHPLPRLKPVNVNIEFVRGARAGTVHAVGRVTRAGRRIANVSAEAWQDDPAKPVATAWLNVLLAAN